MTDSQREAGQEETSTESKEAKNTEEEAFQMLNHPTPEVKLAKRNLNQRCTGKVKVVVAMVAIADTAVAAVDSETAAMTAEVMVVIETAVANVTEAEIEAMVAAAVASQVDQKFPLFPRVRLQICCQTISGSRTSTIKDRYSFIVLILEFSTPIETLDMKLSEASRAN